MSAIVLCNIVKIKVVEQIFAQICVFLEQKFAFCIAKQCQNCYNILMKKGDLRLQEIYSYIKNFIDDNGFPPSVREIGEKFAIKSTSTVHYYLEKLREQGLITQDFNKKRAFTLKQSRSHSQYVPLLGKVSAGKGMLAVENIEGEYPLPQDLFTGDNMFMLRVEGDSMINAGIADGDFVIVNSQSSADINEIVVAMWQDKATVKRLHALYPNLVLHPENDEMSDIVITPDESPTILGKVIGCIKKF